MEKRWFFKERFHLFGKLHVRLLLQGMYKVHTQKIVDSRDLHISDVLGCGPWDDRVTADRTPNIVGWCKETLS